MMAERLPIVTLASGSHLDEHLLYCCHDSNLMEEKMKTCQAWQDLRAFTLDSHEDQAQVGNVLLTQDAMKVIQRFYSHAEVFDYINNRGNEFVTGELVPFINQQLPQNLRFGALNASESEGMLIVDKA